MPPAKLVRMANSLINDVDGRARVAVSAALRFPSNCLAMVNPLHVAGSFVDAADFRVAVQLFDRVILRKAHATEDLDGFGGDRFGDLRRRNTWPSRPRSETAGRRP